MTNAFRFVGVILVLAGLPWLVFNWAMGAGMIASGAVLLLLTAGRRSPGSTAENTAQGSSEGPTRAEPGAAPDRRGMSAFWGSQLT